MVAADQLAGGGPFFLGLRTIAEIAGEMSRQPPVQASGY